MKMLALPALAMAVALPLVACSAQPIEEESASTTDALFGGAVCRVASSATANGVRVTVRAGVATAGCVAVAWTAAGVGEVGCLAPAAGTAVSAVATALAAGIAWLTCGSTVVRVVPTTTTAPTTGTSACDTEPLANGCDVEECKRRYALQKSLCREGGSCAGAQGLPPSETLCSGVERVMNVSRNCINSRRDVQRCFARPDFDGHQTAINEQCQRFRHCMSIGASCESAGLADVPSLPSPCAF
jgi:hypothetical protein